MFSRDGGYIVPAARRAELIVSLAVRNLVLPTDGSLLPDAYFRLTTVDGVPIYRSEIASQTCNPTWLPIDWAHVSEQKLYRDERLHCSSVIAQVLIVSRRSNPWDSRPQPGSGRAFFSAAVQLCPTDIVLIEASIDLRALRFIGAEVHNALSAFAGDTSGGDDPSVVELPLNAFLLLLEDGFYSVPPSAILPRVCESSSAAITAVPGGFMDDFALSSVHQQTVLPTARYDMRRAFDAINRLMQLRRDTTTAHAAAHEASTSLATMLGLGSLPHETNAIAQQLIEKVTLVAELRRRRDAVSSAAKASQESLARMQAELASGASQLQHACKSLQELSEALPFMEASIEGVRSEVSLLRTLITAKQLSLIADLRQLYPIAEVERGRQYSIKGLSMPHRDNFHLLREEHLSTVLGYTAHIVTLLAKYLQIPLRYAISHAASRSTLRDEVMLSAGREFPLYGKTAAPDEFACATAMLARDVRQLLHSQGLVAGELHMLADLQRLFSALLDSQLVVPQGMPLLPPAKAQ